MEEVDKNRIPEKHEMNELYRTVASRVTDDPMLLRMVDLIFEDPLLKPRDLAKLLGTSIKEVNNAQKRLRRRLKDVHEMLKKS